MNSFLFENISTYDHANILLEQDDFVRMIHMHQKRNKSRI